MILMNGGVVAYYSGRQSIVALCTAMAETIALAKLVVKVKHMRALLFGLQCRQQQETMINSTCAWVDNTAAIAVATGNDFTHETVNSCEACDSQGSFSSRMRTAEDHHDHVYQDKQEHC
jgi:hypothetical protein